VVLFPAAKCFLSLTLDSAFVHCEDLGSCESGLSNCTLWGSCAWALLSNKSNPFFCDLSLFLLSIIIHKCKKRWFKRHSRSVENFEIVGTALWKGINYQTMCLWSNSFLPADQLSKSSCYTRYSRAVVGSKKKRGVHWLYCNLKFTSSTKNGYVVVTNRCWRLQVRLYLRTND